MASPAQQVKLLNSTDAQLWAKEFNRIFAELHEGTTLDESWLIGWFANAIETGRDAGLRVRMTSATPKPRVGEQAGSRTPLVDAIIKKFPHSAQLEELARNLEAERDLLREREAELVAALQDAKGGMALAYHCAERKFNDEVLLHLGAHGARIDAALAKHGR